MNVMHKEQDGQDGTNIRKPYVAPQVQIYGDLRQITHTVKKGTGASDNSGGNNTH
jgi:hypothetical protein